MCSWKVLKGKCFRKCLRRPRIFGVYYVELFLCTCQPTSLSEIIPDLLQDWKAVFLLSEFWHETAYFDLIFTAPVLRFPFANFFEWTKIILLYHYSDKKKKGFKGANNDP